MENNIHLDKLCLKGEVDRLEYALKKHLVNVNCVIDLDDQDMLSFFSKKNRKLKNHRSEIYKFLHSLKKYKDCI